MADLRRFNFAAMLNCLEVGEHRSINGAAQAIGITQPALSRSVRALEDELGVPLFRRASTGVAPTPFGETLLAHARVVQSELERCVQDIEELRRSGRARVQVGGTPGVAGRLLAPAALELLREREDMNVGLVEAMPDDLHGQLLRGAIDLYVAPRGDRPAEQAVEETPLLAYEIGIVVGPRHPLLKLKRVPMGRLAGLRWVVPAHASAFVRRFEQEFARAGIAMPDRVFSTNSFLSMRQVLIETDSVALLPVEYVAEDIRSRTLRRLRVARDFAPMEYAVFVRRSNPLPEAVASFRARLLEAAMRRRHSGAPAGH